MRDFHRTAAFISWHILITRFFRAKIGGNRAPRVGKHTVMKDEQHAAARSRRNSLERARRVRIAVERNAVAPLCACGCNERVKWNSSRHDYSRYKFNHHQRTSDGVNLTPRQEQIILGTLIGDGNAAFVCNRQTKERVSARLRINHSIKQLAYAEWLCEELQPLTDKVVIRKNGGYGEQTAALSSLSHQFILGAASQIYVPDKTITREYLERLTPLSVAVWWMDDGSEHSIATHSFTQKEHEIMIEWLTEKYGIVPFVRIDKRVQKPFLALRQPYVYQMVSLVAPYVIKSLWYKFGRHVTRLLSDGLIMT